MLLFEVGIYAKWCVNMIKTLWNIYIKRKTRNLTRIPIFAMIGGVRMCDFCKSGKRGIILNDDGSIICLTADTVVAIDRDTCKNIKIK